MKGFDGSMDFAYNDPNNLLAAKLRSNLFAFSAAKSLNQYRDFAEAMIGKDGNIKPFNDFRKDVEKINALYNENWLKTEYETAIASAQAAATWEEIVKNKDVAGWLEYLTMDDGKVRPEHVILHHITAPVDDKIWNTIYPPNAWRCRCKVRQFAKGTATPQTELYKRVKQANIQPMFKTNTGKTAMVVDKTHPYFKNVKGKTTELDAVKNYGLRDWSAMHSHMQSYVPAMPSGKDKAQYAEWWAAKVRANGVGGENFALPDKQGNKILFDAAPKGNKGNYFREHVAKREYAWLAEGIITNPDEMWSFYDISKPEKTLIHTYLKYYEEQVLTVVVSEIKGILKAETIYEVASEETFNNLRKGVLLYTNKKF
ncbi:MAG: phage minor head protein [Flavipsychrobacter sp.]